MKALKDHFVVAYNLFNSLSGFSWNPITRRFEAEEEVWENFIRISYTLLVLLVNVY